METGFRFIEHKQAGRGRRQEEGDPQQMGELDICKFRRLKRAQDSVLLHLDLKPALTVRDVYTSAREGILYRVVQSVDIADFSDRLKGRSQIGPIVTQNRSVGADLR